MFFHSLPSLSLSLSSQIPPSLATNSGSTTAENDVECYENEMASFDFSTDEGIKKTAKLSESSLQRVTPDSGIALNYQSSVSSVGSLSPPIEKAAGEEMSKTFQSYDGGQVSVPDMQDLHKKSSPLPPPISDHLGPSRIPAYSNSAGNSPSSSPNTPTMSGKGMIPLSHAPGNMNGSLMYGTSQMGSPVGSAGGMIHSSPLTNSINTAFPFNNSYTNGMHHHPHHHSSSSSASFHQHQPYVMSHHQSMFSPGHAYARSPYGTTGPFQQYIQHQGPMQQQQQYRAYPQSPIARNNYQQHYNSNGSLSSSSPVSAFSAKPAPTPVSMPPPALISHSSSSSPVLGGPALQQVDPTSPNLGISATTPTKHIESQGDLEAEEEVPSSMPPPGDPIKEQEYRVSPPPTLLDEIQPVIKEERQEEHQFFTKR